MSVKEQLRTDLTTAMKARDEVTASTLRMVLTAITTEEVAGKQARVLCDDEVLKVIAREGKKRREAIEAYTSAGREELADRERAEAAVIDRYLPAQLDDAQLAALVTAAIAEAGAGDPKAMGQVMKVLTPQLAGRAEGSRVAAEVRRQLGGQ
jgi:uncharacterized protein